MKYSIKKCLQRLVIVNVVFATLGVLFCLFAAYERHEVRAKRLAQVPPLATAAPDSPIRTDPQTRGLVEAIDSLLVSQEELLLTGTAIAMVLSACVAISHVLNLVLLRHAIRNLEGEQEKRQP